MIVGDYIQQISSRPQSRELTFEPLIGRMQFISAKEVALDLLSCALISKAYNRTVETFAQRRISLSSDSSAMRLVDRLGSDSHQQQPLTLKLNLTGFEYGQNLCMHLSVDIVKRTLLSCTKLKHLELCNAIRQPYLMTLLALPNFDGVFSGPAGRNAPPDWHPLV